MRLGHSSKDTFVPELIDGSQQTKTKRKDEKDKKWKGPRVKGLDVGGGGVRAWRHEYDFVERERVFDFVSSFSLTQKSKIFFF